MPITEAVLYEYRNMCAGRYGAQWMAIRKLSDKVRRLKRDLLTTKPAGVIRNEEVDSVVRCSLEPHRSFTPLMQPQMAWSLSSRPDVQRITFGIGEAADRLGVSKTTLWSLVRRDWAAAG